MKEKDIVAALQDEEDDDEDEDDVMEDTMVDDAEDSVLDNTIVTDTDVEITRDTNAMHIHEHVEAPVLVHDARHEPRAVALVADVRADEGRAPSGLGDLGDDRLALAGIAVGCDDAAALLG